MYGASRPLVIIVMNQNQHCLISPKATHGMLLLFLIPVVAMAAADQQDLLATIPMQDGLYGGDAVSYIITDSSDAHWAALTSESSGWNVELAPPLSHVPNHNILYVFTNGTEGNGLLGYQDDIFRYMPADAGYAATSQITTLDWVSDPATLSSASDVEEAISSGMLLANRTGVVLNTPHTIWPGGQMGTGEHVASIDAANMTVTFVVHSAWGPLGEPAYYILIDTPSDSGGDHTSSLYAFTNGIPGMGLAGFQSEIVAATPGSDAYSPMHLVQNVTWIQDAELLTSMEHIRDGESDMDILVDKVVNAPIIDPFQNMVVGGVGIGEASPVLGDPRASVTIIEFGDYQCPNCKRWFDNTKPLLESEYIHTGQANMYFADLAFIGSDSWEAAAASYCAQNQNMYWEYHHTLYKNQGRWGSDASFVEYAADLGMNTTAFATCMEQDHRDRTIFNIEQARSAGINYTPGFVVSGPAGTQYIHGNQPYIVFERVIEAVSE